MITIRCHLEMKSYEGSTELHIQDGYLSRVSGTSGEKARMLTSKSLHEFFHVASLFTAWQSQDNLVQWLASPIVLQDSKEEASIYYKSYDLALKVTLSHFHCILLII